MIIRAKPLKSNFTIISNSIIDDATLAWRDVALLIYLLSKPDSWSVNVSHLSTKHQSSTGSIYQSLKRLRAAGYVYYSRKSTGKTYWFIFDTKQKDPASVIKKLYDNNSDLFADK